MAILITTESLIKTIKPSKEAFGLEELSQIIDGWLNPVKIGPLWVMYNEECKNDLNQVATTVFNVPMHGPVLVVPVQQLPKEWDLMDSMDSKFSGEEVDLGFLVSLQNSLLENEISAVIIDTEREDWYYDPNLAETIEESRDFFDQIYDYFIEKEVYDDLILFEDENTLIQVESIENLKSTIVQMIDIYQGDEEYEKCAILKKILDGI